MSQLAEVRKAVEGLTNTEHMETFLKRQTKDSIEDVFLVVDSLQPTIRDTWYDTYAKLGRLY